MAIMIENMQMPENCCVCPFIQYDDYASGCPFHCPITYTSFEEDDCYAMKNRYEKCPLQERKTGKWVPCKEFHGYDEFNRDAIACSVCNVAFPETAGYTVEDMLEDFRYCPNCGADMRRKDDQETQ